MGINNLKILLITGSGVTPVQNIEIYKNNIYNSLLASGCEVRLIQFDILQRFDKLFNHLIA